MKMKISKLKVLLYRLQSLFIKSHLEPLLISDKKSDLKRNDIIVLSPKDFMNLSLKAHEYDISINELIVFILRDAVKQSIIIGKKK
jgi:hypothetical protein